MRFLEYMGFVLAVFPLKYGFIIVQVHVHCVPTCISKNLIVLEATYQILCMNPLLKFNLGLAYVSIGP